MGIPEGGEDVRKGKHPIGNSVDKRPYPLIVFLARRNAWNHYRTLADTDDAASDIVIDNVAVSQAARSAELKKDEASASHSLGHNINQEALRTNPNIGHKS